MASVRNAFASLTHSLKLNPLTLISCRPYTVFPPNYIKPIIKREDQQKLSETDLRFVTHSMIKPALTTDSSSEFFDEEIRKFINYIMRHGKRQLARLQMEKTLMLVKRKQIKRYHEASEEEKKNIILNPRKVFSIAIENCIPVLELKKIYRGGIAYRVPTPLVPKRGRFLAMNWFVQAAKDHDSHTSSFADALSTELIQASEFEGRVMKRKQELHRQCEANRAYAHFRWINQKNL